MRLNGWSMVIAEIWQPLLDEPREQEQGLHGTNQALEPVANWGRDDTGTIIDTSTNYDKKGQISENSTI